MSDNEQEKYWIQVEYFCFVVCFKAKLQMHKLTWKELMAVDALDAATKSDRQSYSQEGRELSLKSSGEDKSPYALQGQHIS